MDGRYGCHPFSGSPLLSKYLSREATLSAFLSPSLRYLFSTLRPLCSGFWLLFYTSLSQLWVTGQMGLGHPLAWDPTLRAPAWTLHVLQACSVSVFWAGSFTRAVAPRYLVQCLAHSRCFVNSHSNTEPRLPARYCFEHFTHIHSQNLHNDHIMCVLLSTWYDD